MVRNRVIRTIHVQQSCTPTCFVGFKLLSTYSTCTLAVCVHYPHIPLMANSDLLRRDRNNVDAIFVKAMCFYYQVLL